MTEQKMRMSKSKVHCWYQCPYKYKVENIDGWRPSKTPFALEKGIGIHRVLEACTCRSKTMQDIQVVATNHPDYKKYAVDIFNFLKWQRNMPIPQWVELKLYDEELDIVGVLDRVHVERHDKRTVIDYKTGKSKTNLKEYEFELAVYVHLFEKIMGLKIHKWGVFFTSDGTYLEAPVKREAIPKALKLIEHTKKHIHNAIKKDSFPKKDGWYCPWCSLKQNGKCGGDEEWLFKN